LSIFLIDRKWRKRLSRPGVKTAPTGYYLEPGLPSGGPRSAMTGTGIPCPRSTLESRCAHRPCQLWSMICRRPELSSPAMLMDPFCLDSIDCGAQVALPALELRSPRSASSKPSPDRLARAPKHARPSTRSWLCAKFGGAHVAISAAPSSLKVESALASESLNSEVVHGRLVMGVCGTDDYRLKLCSAQPQR